MNIELASPTHIKITWPYYDDATEIEIVRRLNTVPRIEGHGRRYYAPVVQVYRLMDLFPKASYDYAALQGADALAQAFYEGLIHFGLDLTFDGSGSVCVFGKTVSPLIQQLVDERAHALRQFVGDKTPKATARSVTPLHGPQSVEDGKWETWLSGVHNAAKKESKDKVKYPKRRRKGKLKQEELGV